MTLSLSRRVQRVKPSPTLAVTARAARLKAEGKDVIGLGAGEPDFDTPAHIAQAGIEAIKSGFTRYTNVDGINELKDAIIAKFDVDNAIRYERGQILVSSGAKQTIYNLCMAVLDPGDEAIIPAPYWVSYPDMVMLADGHPVMPFAGPAQGYKITPRQLAAAITPKTRLVLLNSPCNPTGAAYTRAELRALGEVLLEYPRVIIGTDDMYEKIYWAPEPFCSLLTAVPELYNRTITINGVSKAYAMTGWRIGYCGGPKEIITAMGTIQGQSTSNASSISQKAAVVALSGDQTCVAKMNEAFKARHDFVVKGLNALPGVSCLAGAGTFYAFADVSKAMAALGCREDGEFAELLLNEGGVAVVPGGGFGAPGHIRISFATSMQNLEKAIERMERVLAGRTVAKSA
ncbi:MAG: aspartate aminotransferase [Gammaproteobacteria bacterium]|nr:aspartate aminotransferase [Gammaproteobacteria bacterium]